MDDDISVLERISHAPNKALGPFGSRVDGDEAEGSFGRSHDVDRPKLFLFGILIDVDLRLWCF